MFNLHPQLAADTLLIEEWPLSLVLLAKDANYPWCILVPKRIDIREIHQLNQDDRLQLLKESCQLAEIMESNFSPIKMNVAALGNMVPQLHIHHVARFEDDIAWPKPIWGVAEAKKYEDSQLEERVTQLKKACASFIE